MATNFFEHQDVARKKTGHLVLLFGAAITGIVVLTYLVAIIGLGMANEAERTGWWNPQLLVSIGGVTLLVVGGASLFKIAQLKGGGAAIAESMGGRPVDMSTTDAAERKLMNIVEEMAIASGTACPPVYVMDHEQGINAFAAGYSPNDAVIGVTRGCIEKLDREQLQGVIAHEFSHILNGDMRLNIRMMGVLFGILVIGMIGYYLLRISFYAGSGRRRGKEAGGLLALGLGLMIVGFIGSFFGSLIKAAVSRQREFLADASAVQFTRNPDGIGGALKAIGGFDKGSDIDHPNAQEVSHMFFGQGVGLGLSSLFATHPPLAERIKRIDPSWDGMMLAPAEGGPAVAGGAAMGFAGGGGVSTAVDNEPIELDDAAFDHIGEPTPAHLAYAHQLRMRIPDTVIDAAHEPYGARAVIYAMLINDDAPTRQAQLEALSQHADPGVFAETGKLMPIIDKMETTFRLPLIDLATPALRALSPKQYEDFRKNVRTLVLADKKIDLFEWALQRILTHHLEPLFNKTRPPKARYNSLRAVEVAAGVTVSTLAYAGHSDKAEAAEAYTQAAPEIGLDGSTILPMEACGLDPLGKALDELAQATPPIKQKVLHACAVSIAADGKVSISEAELFRAICDSLDCPMPPLLPGQPLV